MRLLIALLAGFRYGSDVEGLGLASLGLLIALLARLRYGGDVEGLGLASVGLLIVLLAGLRYGGDVEGLGLASVGLFAPFAGLDSGCDGEDGELCLLSILLLRAPIGDDLEGLRFLGLSHWLHLMRTCRSADLEGR